MPEPIPVPVTTSPTAIVPELPSTVTLADELTAPFTTAVAKFLSVTNVCVTVYEAMPLDAENSMLAAFVTVCWSVLEEASVQLDALTCCRV